MAGSSDETEIDEEEEAVAICRLGVEGIGVLEEEFRAPPSNEARWLEDSLDEDLKERS